MAAEHFAGLDLGQNHDFTALAMLEYLELKGEWDAARFAWRKKTALRLRYLERMPLGTPYPDVVEEVAEAMHAPALAGRRYLMVDATGVGRPVVDMFRRADLAGRMWPVQITAGNRETLSDGYYGVPKRDLIVGLQVLLQAGRLQIASRIRGAEALVREMAEMRVRLTPGGHEKYGVWREGEHDDLVLAVALACWGVGKIHRNVLSGDAGYWTAAEDVRLWPGMNQQRW